MVDKLSKNPVRQINVHDLNVEFLDSEMKNQSNENEESPSPGSNLILYGAPGTGKSYKVDKIVGNSSVVRTVFHPDTQNSDFFGCLKPHMDGESVRYEFSPGPFSIALRDALLDPKHQHYLVIEELNRAPAAAVFGEIFQLLDRKGNGESSYYIQFPSPESKAWFSKNVGPEINQLFIPSNLTIIATMNSADQGVYPLDTAFRRRWEQEYLPLYEGSGPSGKIEFTDTAGTARRISWRSFIECVNEWLMVKHDVPEDRLLGQWFVKERELNAKIPSKVLLYLWDDLFRHDGRDLFFSRALKSYAQLNASIMSGRPIFSDAFLKELESKSDLTATTEVNDLNGIGEDQ